ncbi:MAG: hypothetical protein U5L00_12830 [Desulfovermiculus sp.]|nr:hypothetical protein [Desulfovermiculus sp.]
MAEALHREMAELKSWFDLGLEQRGGTALVTSDPESAATLIVDYLVKGAPSAHPDEFTPGVALGLAARFEGILSQGRHFPAWRPDPGQQNI